MLTGSRYCRTHAGRRSEVIKAEYAANERARKLYAQYQVADLDDPLMALKDQAAKVLAWQAVCEAQLHDLREVRYRAGSGEQTRAEIQIWERALDRSNKILADLVRLNIEDRLVRLSERQGALMSNALQWLLGGLGVQDNDQARALVVTMLQAVGQGTVPAPVAPVLRLVPTGVAE